MERLPTAPYRLKGYCYGAWKKLWNIREEHFGLGLDFACNVQGGSKSGGKDRLGGLQRSEHSKIEDKGLKQVIGSFV